jgi:hypothetical protein
VGDPSIDEFPRVWLELVPPRRAWTAFFDHARGGLTIDRATETASFRGRNGEVYDFGDLTDVTIGLAGGDAINQWVSFRWGGRGDRHAYVMDGGWLGWRGHVTASNRRMFEALKSLSGP